MKIVLTFLPEDLGRPLGARRKGAKGVEGRARLMRGLLTKILIKRVFY